MFTIDSVIIIVLFFTAFITLSICIYASRKKDSSSASAFSLIMLAASIHTIGYTFELLSETEIAVIFWLNFKYIGISFLPFIFIYYAIDKWEKSNIFKIILMIFFFSISLTTFFIVQTNSFHGLFYKELILNKLCKICVNDVAYGIWFYIHIAVIIFSVLISIWIGYKGYKNKKNKYKSNSILIIISFSIPIVVGILYIFKMTPKNIDIMTFTYAPMGVLWLIAILKHGTIEILPVTYQTIFEKISEGVIVLDSDDNISDYNFAAKNMLILVGELHVGDDILNILKKIKFIDKHDYSGTLFEVRTGTRVKIYQIKPTDVYSKKGKYLSKLLVINDITIEAEASRLLKTFARRDDLTGINNRRYFFELCNIKIKEAKLNDKSISFVMMDIDHFKKVNDLHGHLVGDVVLKELAEICREGLRNSDIIGRYGGEEFAILIYDANDAGTYNVIERIRKTISEHIFYVNGYEEIKLTASFGIYTPEINMDESIDSIFKKADEGLYRAKNDGRDKVVFYNK